MKKFLKLGGILTMVFALVVILSPKGICSGIGQHKRHSG